MLRPAPSPRALVIAAVLAALPACGSARAASMSPSSPSMPSAYAGAVASGGAMTESAMAAPAMYAPAAPGAPVAPAARASMGIALASATTPGAADPLNHPRASSTQPATMLVYTANLGLAVDGVPASIERAIQVASAAGGYLASRGDAVVQLRVPTPRFREVMATLEALGDVTHRDVQAEDVSEQYHDLEVQLANLRAVRARLQDFLSRASNIRDALEVEHELERVGAQIDQAEGRIAFLANRAAYSTVTVALVQRAHATVAPPAPPADAPTVALPFAWIERLDLRNLLRL